MKIGLVRLRRHLTDVLHEKKVHYSQAKHNLMKGFVQLLLSTTTRYGCCCCCFVFFSRFCLLQLQYLQSTTRGASMELLYHNDAVLLKSEKARQSRSLRVWHFAFVYTGVSAKPKDNKQQELNKSKFNRTSQTCTHTPTHPKQRRYVLVAFLCLSVN